MTRDDIAIQDLFMAVPSRELLPKERRAGPEGERSIRLRHHLAATFKGTRAASHDAWRALRYANAVSRFGEAGVPSEIADGFPQVERARWTPDRLRDGVHDILRSLRLDDEGEADFRLTPAEREGRLAVLADAMACGLARKLGRPIESRIEIALQAPRLPARAAKRSVGRPRFSPMYDPPTAIIKAALDRKEYPDPHSAITAALPGGALTCPSFRCRHELKRHFLKRHPEYRDGREPHEGG